MIRINQLTLSANHKPDAIKKKAAKLLHINENDILKIHLVRRSIDARKKDNPLFSYIVDVEFKDETTENSALKKSESINIKSETRTPYSLPSTGETPLQNRPVIIGAGPAGLFAALMLAQSGFAPLILERGDDVDARTKKVNEFWEKGAEFLDENSNVQFGEGGAGTFSDGKLNTLVKDTHGRSRKVLETFVECGADSSILYDSMPHIGTDVLRSVVKELRNRIISLGAEVRFNKQVTDFIIENNVISGLILKDGSTIKTDAVIVAAGHSARDLFETLNMRNVYMTPKAFAVGLRVQHPQKQINLSQYGVEKSKLFGAAPYKVTAKTSFNRGVYSFCMCPGGYVVNASSEKGRLAVNGMSNFDRGSENANSAIIVSVTPDDFGSNSPLSGVYFQRTLEEKAFKAGNGKIPVQLFEDFKENRRSQDFGDVAPCFCGGTNFANLREVLPQELSLAFIEGMGKFGRKIRGFDRPDAILAGVESRTSSPVRIERDENFESNVKGLYPCGEGAGYAGGITSAAMDGMKVAEAIISKFYPKF